MSKVNQTLTDLIQLHGWLKGREDWPSSYAPAVAKATKALFPKSTLSQAMEADLEKAAP